VLWPAHFSTLEPIFDDQQNTEDLIDRSARDRYVTSPADGERKTVTVLFADIKGSMELMRDLDPAEARASHTPILRVIPVRDDRFTPLGF
jgi:class 3 adenylate cyclase